VPLCKISSSCFKFRTLGSWSRSPWCSIDRSNPLALIGISALFRATRIFILPALKILRSFKISLSSDTKSLASLMLKGSLLFCRCNFTYCAWPSRNFTYSQFYDQLSVLSQPNCNISDLFSCWLLHRFLYKFRDSPSWSLYFILYLLLAHNNSPNINRIRSGTNALYQTNNQ